MWEKEKAELKDMLNRIGISSNQDNTKDLRVINTIYDLLSLSDTEIAFLEKEPNKGGGQKYLSTYKKGGVWYNTVLYDYGDRFDVAIWKNGEKQTMIDSHPVFSKILKHLNRA